MIAITDSLVSSIFSYVIISATNIVSIVSFLGINTTIINDITVNIKDILKNKVKNFSN